MAVSGSRDWVLTRNDIITAAYHKIGIGNHGATIAAAKYADAAQVLNMMQLSWQNEGIFLWTQADDLQLLTAATASYTLDADILEVNNVFFRHDGTDTPLTSLTREEYKNLSDKAVAGTPTRYFIDCQLAAPVIYLWPVYAYSTGCVVGTDTNNYLCSNDHTSAAATNKPITGTSYDDYWESTSETGAAWADETAYYSGVVRFTKVYRLQDFDASTDNPDFPARWMNALIWGLAAELAPENKQDMSTIAYLEKRARDERQKAWNANGESAPLRISPRIRRV